MGEIRGLTEKLIKKKITITESGKKTETKKNRKAVRMTHLYSFIFKGRNVVYILYNTEADIN